jgi:hypothetical protein
MTSIHASLNDIDIHFSKERWKSFKIKINIFIKLFNKDETNDRTIWRCNNIFKIDLIRVKKNYLWIILFLKCTFCHIHQCHKVYSFECSSMYLIFNLVLIHY